MTAKYMLIICVTSDNYAQLQDLAAEAFKTVLYAAQSFTFDVSIKPLQEDEE